MYVMTCGIAVLYFIVMKQWMHNMSLQALGMSTSRYVGLCGVL